MAGSFASVLNPFCSPPPPLPVAWMLSTALKPQSQIGAQIVVQGKVHGNAKAAEYMAMKQKLLPHVLESFERMNLR